MRKVDLVGKTAFVTGASRGIGAATARELAARGARVALVGLEPEALAAVIEDLPGQHICLEADVTDQGSLDAAVRITRETFGSIDIVVANAGVTNLGSVLTADPDSFARTIDVNLTGVYRTVAAALPDLMGANGYVLVIGSVASLTPLPGAGAYAASKAAVDALVRNISIELAGTGVGVGIAYPSWIETDMVRAVEEALPTFKKLRAELPWPVRTTSTPAACARALADGIQRRAKRIYFPRAVVLLAASRSLVASTMGEAVIKRRAGDHVAQLDVEAVASRKPVTQPMEQGT